MGEFSDDDGMDLAGFDLDAAVASARKAPRGVPSPTSHSQNSHPNHAAHPCGATTPTGSTKRPALGCAGSAGCGGSGSKKARAGDEGIPALDEDDASSTAIPDGFKAAMTAALERHFGHSSFRPGQLAVLRSLLGDDGTGEGGRDTCVFWATGAGKSLCYQLPPLYLNQVAIVVSPLISLMEDQVAKLNGRSGSEIATFLGSSQSNYMAEQGALNGEYRLVYVTPEKLTQGGFCDRLANMHSGGIKICCIAVDESHCVSEWGHDFRPSFLNIGKELRGHPVLAGIPLLALTATAVPRVQQDIVRNLRMRPDATVAKKSFDRTNLKISVHGKPRNGPRGAFEPMAKELARAIVKQGGTRDASKTQGVSGKSTIVYCATKKEVEGIAATIAQSLAHQLVRQHARAAGDDDAPLALGTAEGFAAGHVKPYHAGFSPGQRTETHLDFLVGRVSIIVATVAFGMGIDKPDIRRVVHWGPPKTVEEYYQQMGRAGRDGLPAECVMYADPNDFLKYKGEFYLGGLSGEARAATVRSMDALRDFALSTEGCRRAKLLAFFDEEPSFGESCGTCDLSLNRKRHGDDAERDFQWEGARVVLFAVMACPGQAMSTIEKIIGGSTVENYRYEYTLRRDPSRVTRKIEVTKEKMKKKKPLDYFKQLVPSLVAKRYLEMSYKKSTHQYSKPYAIYNLTSRGRSVIADGPIMLPVPESVREMERIEEEKKQKTLADLKQKGVDLEQIPQEELESGDGEAIAALKRWHSYVDSMAERGRTDVVDRLDDLKSRIEGWRMDMAGRYRMAPASVMEEHLLVRVAYAAASLRAGTRMDKDALVAAGVRSNGIDELSAALGEWAEEAKEELQGGGDDEGGDLPMSFEPGRPFQPANSWRFSVYKPNKKTGKASWEVSYDRFADGTHPQTIAMTQKSGRPIQAATVVGHILEALVQGRAVDLARLASAEPPPSKGEWEELVRCSVETGLDVTGDPAHSGSNGERFTMKNFLVPIMGNAFALKDFKERTPEESAKFSKWCGCLRYYLAFRRVGYEPSFC